MESNQTLKSSMMEETIVNGIANILSTITILSCLFLKVPQILYIREKQSAEGIYVQAMIMEITGAWVAQGERVPFCTPLSGFAKVTYIYGIIRAGNADAVSLTTWIISVATNLARVFTVYVDSADAKLMANFYISTLLSTGVLLTALYYQRNRTPPPIKCRRRISSHRRYSRND
ncbi:unnamed protein product [Diatraea saccharalis]|uniref:PQ-loop repeat-containing protein 3 n=1 Tax=Diatraea saccharalis TaxID=40085 RepID=A0A9N9R3T8_9NEOP|nr:unnamed protein product [Diatraea saccharalis]